MINNAINTALPSAAPQLKTAAQKKQAEHLAENPLAKVESSADFAEAKFTGIPDTSNPGIMYSGNPSTLAMPPNSPLMQELIDKKVATAQKESSLTTFLRRDVVTGMLIPLGVGIAGTAVLGASLPIAAACAAVGGLIGSVASSSYDERKGAYFAKSLKASDIPSHLINAGVSAVSVPLSAMFRGIKLLASPTARTAVLGAGAGLSKVLEFGYRNFAAGPLLTRLGVGAAAGSATQFLHSGATELSKTGSLERSWKAATSNLAPAGLIGGLLNGVFGTNARLVTQNGGGTCVAGAPKSGIRRWFFNLMHGSDDLSQLKYPPPPEGRLGSVLGFTKGNRAGEPAKNGLFQKIGEQAKGLANRIFPQGSTRREVASAAYEAGVGLVKRQFDHIVYEKITDPLVGKGASWIGRLFETIARGFKPKGGTSRVVEGRAYVVG